MVPCSHNHAAGNKSAAASQLKNTLRPSVFAASEEEASAAETEIGVDEDAYVIPCVNTDPADVDRELCAFRTGHARIKRLQKGSVFADGCDDDARMHRKPVSGECLHGEGKTLDMYTNHSMSRFKVLRREDTPSVWRYSQCGEKGRRFL